jgi:rhodanese-related sulfurtransferase
MRISDGLLKTVGFVSRFEPEGDGALLRFGGTAFIVGVRTEHDYSLAHIVTAKHVAEAIAPTEAVIAMNGKDGEPLFLRTGDQQWFYHPTEPDSVDVAVMPFGSRRFHEYDIEWIPEDTLLTDAKIRDFDVGLGDELTIIGLFTRFVGGTRLTPLVRTGNIAMMPKDKLPTQAFGRMEAYLAEGRSIGGLSGSPVFVRNTVKMPIHNAQGEPGYISGLGPGHLLGLVHGHWDLPLSFDGAQELEAVNMGVSIVVPAKKILETLYHPTLVELRAQFCPDRKRNSAH